jgi:hypothetical protein
MFHQLGHTRTKGLFARTAELLISAECFCSQDILDAA